MGDIVGVKGYESNGSRASIDGVKALDDKTLEITIDSLKPTFWLDWPVNSFCLSKNYMESQGDNWIDKPIGTSPFILREYQIGQMLKLKRNDLYWGEKSKVIA